jgi:hypothetical protein
MRRRLSPLLIAVLSLLVVAGLGGIVLVAMREMSDRGTDVYGNSAGSWPTIKFGIIGFFDALLRTWWLYTLPIIFLQIFDLLPRKSLGRWIADSSEAIGVYCFLIGLYAAQCALYRSSFPHNSRYDFPAMLLVPLTGCILVCEISYKARKYFPERTMEYAQLTAAGFFCFALIIVHIGRPPLLTAAVRANINVTNSFYDELQRLVRSAKQSPEEPIILDAYGPLSYEAVLSLSNYIPALGAKNRISVRFHADEQYKGTFYDGLQQSLSSLQETDTGAFTSLRKTLADPSLGCLSLGIDGRPDAACTGFQVRSGPGFKSQQYCSISQTPLVADCQ